MPSPTSAHSSGVAAAGEETLTASIDWRAEKKDCVLFDMVDGTDLMERGFANWCSAIVVFNPRRARIEGAFVALSDATMYYATERTDGVFKINLNDTIEANRSRRQPISLRIPSNIKKDFRDATVCMYGQKSKNLLSLLNLANERSRFPGWLQENIRLDEDRKSSRQQNLEFRFYNFAGNPMMARLAEGAVDVVFDLSDQYLHDVVPGAFIAMQAGGFLGSTKERREIKTGELAQMLFRPAEKLSYILALNEELYQEAYAVLRESLK